MFGSYRKNIRLLLGIGFFTALALPGTLRAAPPEITFHPAKAWSVKNNQDANNSCSITNEFNNGFIVTMNGFGQRVDSIQIDFLQDAFTAEQNYDVAFSVPGVKAKNLQGYAPTARVLNISLANEASLYKAMRDSSVFDISIGGNSFRFYLSGFANAAGSFESCIGGAPGGQGMMKTQPVSTPGKMPKETMETQSAAMTGEVERMPLDGEPQQQTGDSWGLDGIIGEDKIADAQEPMHTKPESSRVEIERPVESMAEITPPPRNDMIVHKEEYSGDFDFTDIESGAGTTAQPAMAGTHSFGDRPDPDMARTISRLEQDLSAAKRENQALNNELQAALRESKTERTSISSENWNLERATLRYNEAERQIKRLAEQLERSRTQCSVEKRELEAMLFNPQITNEQQMARLADMESQIAKLQSDSEAQRMRYEERIRVLESQLRTQ